MKTMRVIPQIVLMVLVNISVWGQTATLTSPGDNDYINSSITIAFELSHNAVSGTVKLTFTRTGGEEDANSPHVLVLMSSYESMGTHSFTLNGESIVVEDPNISSIESGGPNLVDGAIYSVKIEYDYGGTIYSATNTGITYDTTAPSGYSVLIDQSPIYSGNHTAVSFTFAGAEVGATYSYTISDGDGGTTDPSGSGTIAEATDQITGIDVSGLTDGTLTLSVTLTDAAGNTGTAATDTEVKDATAPSGYAVAIDQSPIYTGNEDAVTFTFTLAEVGATFNYTFSTSGGGTTVSNSGTVTSAGQTVSADDLTSLEDGTITLSVTLTDAAGNTGTAATDTEVKDATAPSGYAVAIDQSPIYSGNQTAVSFTFAGAEVGAAYDYTISSSGGGPNVTGSGTISTATDKISGINVSGLGDGTLTLSVTLTDAAGNTGTAATDTEVKDATAPSAPSTPDLDSGSDTGVSNTDNITSDNTPTFTGTAEAGSTVKLYSGATEIGSVTAIGGIWSITASTLSEGVHSITATATDAAGNTGVASAALSVTIDRTCAAPVVTGITDDNGFSGTDGITNDQNIVINGTAEANSSVQVLIGGSPIGTLTANGSGNWSLDYTGTTLSAGAYSITAIATDVAGNISATSGAFGLTVKLTQPTVSISSTASPATNTSPVPFTITFSEDVENFTLDDISVVATETAGPGGLITKQNLAGSGSSYTFDVAVTYDKATLTVTIPSGGCNDIAGNLNTASSAYAVDFDKRAFTIELTSTEVDSTKFSSIPITITFNKKLKAGSLIDSEISVTNGTVSDLNLPTDIDPTIGSFNIIPSAEGVVTVSIAAGVCKDKYNNDNAESNVFSIVSDRTQPAIESITTTELDPTNANPIPVTVVFSEAVYELLVGEISVTNGTASNLQTADKITYNFDITPEADGDVSAHIPAGVCRDGATNTNTLSATLTRTSDRTPPTVTSIERVTQQYTNLSSVDFLVTFSEPVYDVQTSNFTLSGTAVGATISSISGTGDSRTVTVSTGSTDGTLFLNLTSIGDIKDNASNSLAGTRPCDLGFIVDKTLPELNAVTITSNNTPHPEKVGVGGKVILSITGSEIVKITELKVGTTDSESIEHYTVLTLPDEEKLNWTAEYVLQATDHDGPVIFNIKYIDRAGNQGVDVSSITHSSNVTFDKVPPAAKDIKIDSDYPNEKTVAKVGDVVTVVFTADNSEDIENVVVQINGKNAVVTDKIGYTWTTQYTMSSTDSENSGNPLPFTISFTDYAGNSGSYNSTSETHAGSVTFDKTPPTLSSVSIASSNAASGLAKVGDLITLTFNSSEVVNITSASIAGNAVTPISEGGTGLNWTATYTMQSSDNNGTIPFVINYTDAAGNPGATVTTTSDATSVVFDKTAPSKPGTPVMDSPDDTGISNTDNITSVVRPTFSGSAEPNCTVFIYSSAQELSQSTTSDANGDWSISLSADLTEGAHGIYVTATDAAGNVSVASNSLSVTIDKTAPGAPLSLDLDAASDTGISDTDNITSVKTPTINGTAEVGSTVKLYSGPTLLGSAVADGTGSWSIVSSTLADGTYSLTATATDLAGNVSGLSDALGITIDTQAPVKPSTPDLTPASDTGVSSTDNITSITTPVFLITAEAGSTVKLYSNIQGEIGSGVADGTGTWVLTASTALSEGNHSITATATDVAGNVSLVSSALSITIDITSPAAPSTPDMNPASDSGTSNSDNYTNVVRPTLTGTAETYATVEIFSDAVKVGEGTANIFGIWSITITTDLTDGARVITAKATDAAGNVSDASASLTITIDTQKPATPVAPVLDPASNTGSVADNITADTTPTFTGNAENDAIVKLYVNGVENGGVVASGGSWSITTTALTDGAKSITVTATDLAGNVSDTSEALEVIIDATAPAPPSKPDITDASDTGISNTDNITSNKTPVFTGIAEVNSTVKLYSIVDGLIGSATADGTTGEWTITSIALAEGNHSITATATDVAGNVSPISAALAITIDITDPGVPVITGITEDTGTSNTDGVTSDNTPTVNGTSEANALIKIFVGALTYETTANSSGVWSYTLATLADGGYAITAQAVDLAGNESSVSAAYNITVDTTSPNIPTIAGITNDTGRNNADGITSDQNLIINGTSEVNAKIDVFIGAGLIGTTNANGSGSWSFDYTGTTLAAGSYTISAKATDIAGNVSASSVGYPIIIDITAPNAPVVTSIVNDTGHSSSDGITSDQTLIFNGTSEANALVEIFVDGTSVSTVLANGIGEWTYDHSTISLSEGSHTILATATDVAGNISSASANYIVIIDNTKPTVTLTDNHADAVVRHGDVVTITATFTEANGIDEGNKPRVTIGTLVTNAEMFMASNLIWRYVWEVPAGTEIDGDVNVSITASDVAGNPNTSATGKVSYTVDNTQPTVVLTDDHPDAIVKSGDVVTITATFSEVVNTPKITIGNLVLSQDMSVAGPDWTYTWAVPADFNGTVNVSISATDIAGNPNAVATAGVDGTTSFTVDNTQPTVVLSDNHPDAIVKNGVVVLITATFTEANGMDEDTKPQLTIGGTTHDMVKSTNLVWTYQWTVSEASDGPIALSITASDVAGNANAAATGKTSYTIDNTLPTLTSVSISSNHSNTDKAKAGSVITVNFTSSETIQSVTATILGNVANVSNVGGNLWKATYIAIGDETTEGVDKVVDFQIDFEDVAGNSVSATNIHITDGTSVTLDITKSVFNLVTIYSDHTPHPDRARIGSFVTVEFTSDEPIEGVSATINSVNASVEAVVGETNTWRAFYYMRSVDLHNTNVTFAINCKDLAGNSGVQQTAVTDASQVTFDKVKPTFTQVSIYSNNTTSTAYAASANSVFVEFATSEDVETPEVIIHGVAAASITGGPTVWLASRELIAGESEGVVPFTIDVVDLAGNESLTRYTTTDASSVTFDDQEPNITAISVAPGVYKVGDIVSVFIQADNNSYVGVTVEVNGKGQTLVNNNNNTYSISYLVEEGDNDVINSGSLPVNIVLRDNAGNIATRSAAVTTSGKITVDANTPQIQSVTSTAEDIGSLLVGDQLTFTVTPVIAEEGLLINPSIYNAKPITWSTTDGGVTYTATYTVQEGDPTQEPPLQLGSLTITDQAGNISSSYDYTLVKQSIFATSPTATIKGSITKCDYGQLVPVRFELTGYAPFQLQYSDGVDIFDVADYNDYIYEIMVERGSFTLVKLTDAKGNFTTTALQNAIITVNPLPVITLNILGSPFNVNEQRILLTDFATPAGGSFSGDGVSTVGYFYPNMIELVGNEKVVPITYTYTNAQGCTNSATQNVVVSTGGAYIEGFSATSVYCQYSNPFEVEGRNPSSIVGRFSLSGTGLSKVFPDNNFLTIDPGELNAGDYNLRYEYDDGGTTFAASKAFTIDSVGSQIDFGQLLDEYCADAGVVSLQATGLFPLGGTGYFTGPTPGFNPTTAVFEPSKVSKFDETYSITYHYISPLGCSSDTIVKTVRVNALPVINFTIRDNYNSDEDPVTLSGVPGGTFSDNQGIIVNNILYPSRTTPGFINVTLNYTQDITGCSNTLTKQTRIRKATETIQGLESVYCYSKDTIDISTQVVDDPTIVGQFYSEKGAIVSTGVNSARYSIARAGNGNDVITFKYNVGETPYEISKTVLIDSIGPVTITNLLENYCADAKPISISGYLDNPPQGSRTISYSGTIAAFDVASGGIATLSPSLETPGNYAVTFKFTSAQSGCSRDTTYGLTIHPLPVVVVDFPEYYSIDAEPLLLEGTPTGGTFSAQRGVSGNEFLPALAGPGLMTITYRVQDVHGCVNTAQDGVTVVGADASISGLPTFTCIDSQPFTISGSSNNGLAGEFVGKGIRDKQENSAVFDPVDAGKGVHTITYTYLFEGDGTTELFITRNIEVDSLGVVEFFELDNEYCFNNAGRRISALPVGGTFKVENYLINNVFNPGNARTDTLNPITYTLTNPVSGCSIKGVKDVVVNPVPNINFFLDDPCSDLSSEPVRFKNTTTSVDPVVEWMWRFETNGSITSGDFEPSYIYSTSGSKEVTLVAKTDKDCSIERTAIVYVGLIPKATFSWRNECLTGEETVFTSTSDPTNLVRYSWVFDNQTILDGGVDHRSVNHTFAQVGNHTVEMVIESGDGCLDTIQKQVLIQPYIKLADLPNMVHFDNFEGEEITWDARPIVENQFKSWVFGSPSGSVISTAASGAKAWYTQVDNQQIERSQVLSPCFDLRSLEKPMLKFNLWSSSYQGRDGAVLQYDLDGNNEWAVLGGIGDGINWYNNTIESLPGDQLLGWSHTSMTDWVSARISLDEIKDAPNVRFRIAYATNKFFNPTPYDGIAFDDFWIGNREQNLLLEYFTNATLAQTALPNADMVNLEQQNALDVVPIHYHTSSPSGDPMHSLFAPGIASRQFFYGVSAIPYALVNGLQPFGFASFGQNQIIVNVEQLKDPEMAIAVSGSAGSSINLSVDVTALAPISNQELVLHAILTQKEYGVDEAINGQSIFYNVVRGFVPGPAGTKLPNSWSVGQMETFHINGQLPSGVPRGELQAVIFVQNIQTRRVYQVGVVDVGSITSVARPDEPFTVNLFPNPATTVVRLVSPQLVEQAILLDVSGRTVSVINPNSLQFEIPVDDLKPGLYIIRFKSSSGYSTAKFIKQ